MNASNPDLTPALLNRGGAADQIIADLKNKILQGVYPRGSKLPYERELAQNYQVSGPTIREAIRGLAAVNLVETRRGAGIYVTAAADSIFAAAASALIQLEEVKLLDILETLEALYTKTAMLACVEASDGEIAGVGRALDALDASGPGDDFVDRLSDFLGLIAAASHNVLVATFSRFLVGLLMELVREQLEGGVQDLSKAGRRLNADRRNLVEALRRRDPDLSARMAELYLHNTRSMFSELLSSGHKEGQNSLRRALGRMRTAG